MLKKEQLQNRMQGLNTAIEQSLANHNALLGRKAECADTIAEIDKLESQLKEEKEDVKPA